MSLATTQCRAAIGIDSPLITIEVHLANGLPAFNIVGLPEKAVQESRDRVRSALINSGFEFPARRITVSLAPADLPKEGSRFDLSIAIGILAASGQVPDQQLHAYEFVGELTLAGHIRPVTGILPAAIGAKESGHALFLPKINLPEASLIKDIKLLAAEHLLEVTGHLSGNKLINENAATNHLPADHPWADLADVRGQALAKRALTIAAAGRHNLLMIGPPGSGKSMLANRLPGILPPLQEQEAIETAAIRSISGQPWDPSRWMERPFRTPHHTASGVALVGGSSNPKPGEISLAHNGVLFLDELPEFDRRVLEVLREPMETGRITISRATRQAEFPAQFQLIAAMNPCPCGYLGDPQHQCHCTSEQVARYQGRISGPLMDRIDMHIDVPALPARELRNKGGSSESSSDIRNKIAQAHERQQARQGCTNNKLDNKAIDEYCTPDSNGLNLLGRAMDALGLSARAYHRVLRVARTIADLSGSDRVMANHVTEAIGYRRLDRKR